MLNNLKNTFHWTVYMLGMLAYVVFISINPKQFLLSILWSIFIIYVWIIIGILNKKYNFKHLVYMASFTGAILSIVAFFIYGVEELPYPIGAIRFNTESIILISILLFVFSLPALIIKMGSLETPYMPAPTKTHNTKEASHAQISRIVVKEPLVEMEEWEEATSEDLESGKFEPI